MTPNRNLKLTDLPDKVVLRTRQFSDRPLLDRLIPWIKCLKRTGRGGLGIDWSKVQILRESKTQSRASLSEFFEHYLLEWLATPERKERGLAGTITRISLSTTFRTSLVRWLTPLGMSLQSKVTRRTLVSNITPQEVRTLLRELPLLKPEAREIGVQPEAVELPVELLCEIFWWSLFHKPRYVMEPDLVIVEFDTRAAPLVFAHFNDRWRSAALGCSHIWTHGMLEYSTKQELVSIKKWAEDDHLIVLKIAFDPERDESFFAPEVKMLVTQLGASVPIVDLHLKNIPFLVLSGLPAGLLPHLKYLTLMDHPSNADDWLRTTDTSKMRKIVAFDGISSLAHVYLTRPLLISAGKGLLKLNWSRLEVIKEILWPQSGTELFCVEAPGLSEFFTECLLLCIHLVVLQVYTGKADSGGLPEIHWPSRRVAVPIPSLRSLYIQSLAPAPNGEMLVPDFLHQFTFTGLRELTINGFSGMLHASSGSGLLRALRKASGGAKITSLDIGIATCTTNYVHSCLNYADVCSSKEACDNLGRMFRAFPYVETLILRMPILYDGFFDMLAGDLFGGSPRHPTVRTILPELRTLQFAESCWEKPVNEYDDPVLPKAILSGKFTDFVRVWLKPPGKPSQAHGPKVVNATAKFAGPLQRLLGPLGLSCLPEEIWPLEM